MEHFEILGFTPSFQCTVSPDLPGDGLGRIILFSQREPKITGSGLLIYVKPDSSEDWMGTFQWGDGNYSLVCACPDPNYICVIAEGNIYFVDVRDPTIFFIPAMYPVVNMIAVPDRAKLLFVDFTDLCCVGKQGIEWMCSDLSSDGIQIEWVNAKLCHLKSWSAEHNKAFDVDIDIDTGAIITRI